MSYSTQSQSLIWELILNGLNILVNTGFGVLGKIGVNIGVNIGVKIGLNLFKTGETYLKSI